MNYKRTAILIKFKMIINVHKRNSWKIAFYSFKAYLNK